MERRLAITYIVSATTTFGIACVAFATASGGLFASAASKSPSGTQVEIVDDYIVVRSSTTVATADPAAAPTAPSDTGSASAPVARGGSSAAPAAAPAAPAAEVSNVAPEVPAASPAAPSAPDAPVLAPTPTTVAPARPPIPDGCIDPRFRNGAWKCDDD